MSPQLMAIENKNRSIKEAIVWTLCLQLNMKNSNRNYNELCVEREHFHFHLNKLRTIDHTKKNVLKRGKWPPLPLGVHVV